MACKIIKNSEGKIIGVNSPTGEPSVLFDALAKEVGTLQAYEIYSFARTKEFATWFGGEWDRGQLKKSLFTDDNGEPMINKTSRGLEWINSKGEFRVINGPAFKSFEKEDSIAISDATSGLPSEVEAELLDVISLIAINAMNNEEVGTTKKQSKFLNSNKKDIADKGLLAKSVLALAFEEEARNSKNLIKKVVDYYKVYKEAPSNKIEAVAQAAEKDGFELLFNSEADLYFNVYDNWEDIVSPKTGNVTKGYRSKIKQRLTLHGLKMLDGEFFEQEIEDYAVKIYDRSILEEDPIKKLSQEAKAAINGITQESKYLSHSKSVPNRYVYGLLVEATMGQKSIKAVIANLENLAPYMDNIYPIIQRVQSLDPSQQSAILSNFDLAYKTFSLISIDQSFYFSEFAGTYVKDVKTRVFNPNMNEISRMYRTNYKRNSRQALIPQPRAIYQVNEDGTLEAIPEKLKEARTALDTIESIDKTLTIGESVPVALSDALAEYMWALGMQYGTTLETTKVALETYFREGKKIKGVEMSGVALFRNFFLGTTDNKPLGRKALLELVEKNRDIYEEEGSTIRKVASIAHIFDPRRIVSFVNAMSKQIHPVNYPTNLDETYRDIASGQMKDAIDSMLKDPFFKPSKNNNKYTSILVKKLRDNPEFRANFALEYFDGLKENGVKSSDYVGLNKRQSLLTRLTKYINKGNKETSIAIPTQANRENLNFGTNLRYHKGNKREIIKGLIIQDYARMAQARRQIAEAEKTNDYSNLSLGYHYKKLERDSQGNVSISGLGTAFTQVQVPKKGPLNTEFEEVIIMKDLDVPHPESKRIDSLSTISTYINEYIEGVLDDERTEFIDKEINSQVTRALLDINYAAEVLENVMSESNLNIKVEELDNAKNIAVNKNFLKNFAFDDFVGRQEVSKILRSGPSFSKSQEEFYKRMRLVGTPGTKLAIKGSTSDPNHGMMPTYNALIIEDYDFELADLADQNADKIESYGQNIAGLPAKEAEALADNYRSRNSRKPGMKGVDKGDAGSFISLQMYRSIMDGGRGMWKDEDEEAYLNHESEDPDNPYAGKYVDNNGNARNLYPEKPYHEEVTLRNGTMTLTMDKNSYTVVTKEIAERSPMMQRMLNAFNKGIHVINPISTTKGAKINPQNLYSGELDVSNPIVLDSRKLRFPQMTPRRNKDKITLSTQVSKNILANIDDLGTYTVNGVNISGMDLKEAFHGIRTANIEEDTNNLQSELGLSGMYNNEFGTQEYADSKLKFLKATREVILDQVEDRELGENYEKALAIIPDGEFDYQFRVPISYPHYQKEFEQSFFSVFKKNIFEQKIKGKDLVQVAEPGGYVDKDGNYRELQMYNGTDRAEIKMSRKSLNIPKDMSIEEARKQFPDRLKVILYRIPNSGKNLILPSEVVEFLPDSHSKSIVVPAGIVIQMGSDFDFDKANVIQRENNIQVDIRNKNYKRMNRAQRDALFYDIVDAVITNPIHFREVMMPLDNPVLDNLAAGPLSTNEIVDTFNPLVEITMENRNKTGQTMTGIWANFLSGRNVLENKTKKLLVAENYELKINVGNTAYTLNEVGITEDIFGRTTDSNIAVYLSAAVDASNKPIHVQINDNRYTSQGTGSMMLLGNPVELTTVIAATPYVRAAVRNAELRGNFTGSLKAEIKNIIEKYKILPNLATSANDIKISGPYRMSDKYLTPDDNGIIQDTLEEVAMPNIEDIKALIKENNIEELEIIENNLLRQIGYLYNMVLQSKLGAELQELGALITPDTQKNLNEISALTAFIEKETAFLNRAEPVILGGREFLEATTFIDSKSGALVEGGVYKTSAAYRAIFQTMLNAAEAAGFVNNRPAFYNFKEVLKIELGIETLNQEQHKFIDRILFLKMLANEEGPLANLMSEAAFRDLFLNKKNNIATRLEKNREKFPKLAENLFVKLLEPHPGNLDIGSNVFTIRMINSYSTTPSEKRMIIKDFLRIVSEPESFANNPEDSGEIAEIKRFGKSLVANQLLTTGTVPTTGSYMDLLPAEFVTTRILTGDFNPIAVSPVQDFNYQRGRTLSPEFFRDFVHDFIRNFGLEAKGGRRPFVPIVYSSQDDVSIKTNTLEVHSAAVPSGPAGPASYVAVKNFEEMSMYVITGSYEVKSGHMYIFTRLQALGVPGRVHEILAIKNSNESLIQSNAKRGINVKPAVVSKLKPQALSILDKRTEDRGLPESVEQPLKVCRIL